MLKILYKKSFIKLYDALEDALKDEVKAKIKLFLETKNHSQLKVHKLHGSLRHCWSFSVNYRYRIVFEYIGKTEAHLLNIGDHDVYK